MKAHRKREVEPQKPKEVFEDFTEHISQNPEERLEHLKDLQLKEGNSLFAVQYTTIQKAAGDGSIPGIKYFINQRGRSCIRETDSTGLLPIHYAAGQGIESKGKHGVTPLMLACKKGQLETVKVLLRLGADPLGTDEAGLTAAHFAAFGDQKEVLEELYLYTKKEYPRILQQKLIDKLNEKKKKIVDKQLNKRSSRLVHSSRSNAMHPLPLSSRSHASARDTERRNSVRFADNSSIARELSWDPQMTDRTIGTSRSMAEIEAAQSKERDRVSNDSLGLGRARSRRSSGVASLASASSEEPRAMALPNVMPSVDRSDVATRRIFGVGGARRDSFSSAYFVNIFHKSSTDAHEFPGLNGGGSSAASQSKSWKNVASSSARLSADSADRSDDDVSSVSQLGDAGKDSVTVETAADSESHTRREGKEKTSERRRSSLSEDSVAQHRYNVLEVEAKNGSRPLHVAVSANAQRAIAFLIQAGVDVHAQDTSGDTALHRAARNNLYVAYRMLVAGGALEGARNHMRETPGGLIKDSPAL